MATVVVVDVDVVEDGVVVEGAAEVVVKLVMFNC